MNLTDRAATGQILAATTTTGAKPIPAVADAHARTVKLAAEVRNLGSRRDAIGVAVAACLDRGDDPGADPQVQAILVRQQIANEGVAAQVDALVFETFREVCHEQADALVQSWRVPFDQAAGVLAKAHDQLGNVTLDQTGEILAKGGDAAKTWVNADEASKVIDRIVSGWSALGEFTRLVARDPRYPALRLAAVDPPKWQELQLQHRKVAPWDLVLAGVTLSLPTYAQHTERVRAIESAQARAAADAEQAGLDWATGRQRRAAVPG